MTSFSIYLELFYKIKPLKNALGALGKVSEKLKKAHSGKHKLVDSAEAYTTVIGKKYDFAYDSKEPARFMSRLKYILKILFHIYN